jgi:hypothetical protein
LNPIQISNNGRTLEIGEGNETDYNIDISGLYVDLGCVENARLSNVSDIRAELLKQGCARIVGAPTDAAEQTAQAQAKANHIGLWSQPSGAGKFVQWVKTHKLISIPSIGLLLAVLASPLLWLLFRWIIKVFFRRKVNIIITGAASAGKTGLWMAWKDEYNAGEISGIPPTAGTHRAKIEPVMLDKWTLQPALIDVAGAEPYNVLQGIQSPRGLKGVVVRQRTKRVLLYVVAPTPEETKANGSPFDASYIAMQKGYAHLPVAIIGQHNPSIRPDLVIMFATKFDLLSDKEPTNSNPKANEMVTAFRSHRELVESTCKRANIPFRWIIGSAKNNWNIGLLRKSLWEVIK